MTRDAASATGRALRLAGRVPEPRGPEVAVGPPAPADVGESWLVLAEGLARHPEDGLVVLRAVRDAKGGVVDFRHEYVNAAAERNAGRPLLGSTVLELYSREDASLLPTYCELVGSGQHRQVEVTYWDGARDERLGGRGFQVFLAAVGREHVVCQFRDVTQLRQAQRLLEHQAGHDDLTGLPNRRLLREHLDRTLSRTQHSGGAVLVMLCDLDRFKQVNDTYGHAAGDELLRLVADRLRATVRPPDLVVRYGGDEFCLVCGDVAGGDAEHVVARVQEAASGTYRLGAGVTVQIGVSIGHVLTHRPLAIDDLLKQADAALYAHKVDRA